MFTLTNKKALITGSTQGIGYAVAKAFIEAGADVIIHCRDEQKAERVAKELGAAGYAAADLADPGSAASLYAQTGDVDILICNAGVQYRTHWDEIEDAEFDTQINVNLRSTLKLIQQYYPHMKEQKWGRIVTVGSVQQTNPHPDMAIYAATKCAVMSLVENIAKQVAPTGVTVNNLSPGVIDTPRNAAALADDVYREKVLAGIPSHFAGEGHDLAGAALLLCSDAGRYITGIDLVVDGGMHL